MNSNLINIIAIFINSLTLIAVAIYTIVTYKLFKETTKQTKQGLMPLPIVYKHSRDKTGKLVDKFFVKNIGNGPAININFETFNLHYVEAETNKPTGEVYSIKLKLIDPNVLDKNEERLLSLERYSNGKNKRLIDLAAWLDPNYSDKEIPLTISYQDIMGRKYHFKINFGKGNLKIMDSPKEI